MVYRIETAVLDLISATNKHLALGTALQSIKSTPGSQTANKCQKVYPAHLPSVYYVFSSPGLRSQSFHICFQKCSYNGSRWEMNKHSQTLPCKFEAVHGNLSPQQLPDVQSIKCASGPTKHALSQTLQRPSIDLHVQQPLLALCFPAVAQLQQHRMSLL